MSPAGVGQRIGRLPGKIPSPVLKVSRSLFQDSSDREGHKTPWTSRKEAALVYKQPCGYLTDNWGNKKLELHLGILLGSITAGLPTGGCRLSAGMDISSSNGRGLQKIGWNLCGISDSSCVALTGTGLDSGAAAIIMSAVQPYLKRR